MTKNAASVEAAFFVAPATRLTGHREGSIQHSTIIGLNAEEVDAIVEALRIQLDAIAIDDLSHYTLTDGIVDLNACHTFALDVEHARSRVWIDL